MATTTTTTTTTTREVGGERRGAVVVRAQQMGAPLPPMEQHDPLPCPRCTSTHTKFCYYNNYNFSQPRHFCKSCRRYWTHGGTLRDIPVGGASRKTAKRSRTTTSSPSALSLPSAPPVINNSSAHGMLFTSLLSDNGGFGLGLDEIGFGLRPRVWAGPYGLTNNETNSSGYNHGGGGVSRNDTWHVESGEPLLGFVGADHCFTSLPELAISTSPNALK